MLTARGGVGACRSTNGTGCTRQDQPHPFPFCCSAAPKSYLSQIVAFADPETEAAGTRPNIGYWRGTEQTVFTYGPLTASHRRGTHRALARSTLPSSSQFIWQPLA